MARVYATAADYEAYTGQAAPAGITGALARASRFLDSAVLRLCRYDVDQDGYPSVPVVRDAVRDAVCAQVQWWEETGDESGVAGRWGSVQIGSVSLGSPGPSTVSGRTVAETALEALRSPDLTCKIFVLGLVVS